MIPSKIVGYENEPLSREKGWDRIGEYLFSNDSGKREILGLDWIGKEIQPGNYIGAVWIGKGDDRVAVCVNSKFKYPIMDYMEMFAKCCEDPLIGDKVYGCFDVWAEQEMIETSKADDFSFMVVVAFLRELNMLCARHLRRHFQRRRENFVGKVKGKIIISENLRRNAGHAERVFCEYQSICDDILENRILRAALEKAARYLSNKKQERKAETFSTLQRWVHACRSHLQDVSVMHIAKRDFRAVRERGAFVPYRRSLFLAKAVLYHFGFNPHEEHKKITKAPPYVIDSAALFERYAELKLREQYNIHIPPNIPNPGSGFESKVRPDFYVPREDGRAPKIMDAKYKKFDGDKPDRDDVYQVVAYSQHRGLLRRVNKGVADIENTDDLELFLVYPRLDNKSWPEHVPTEAFKVKLSVRGIPCPFVEE